MAVPHDARVRAGSFAKTGTIVYRKRIVERSELSAAEFEAVVEEALASLPPRFSAMIDNVVVAVEEEPSDEDLACIDADDGGELLGIYRGVSLVDRDRDAPLMPDEIAVFRGPINRVARTRKEAVREVRETVVHELGHYFGLDDEEMPH